MKRCEIIFILAFVIMLGSISASSLGIFSQDSTISLHQICDNCTFVNLTSIKFPNGSLRAFNKAMTKVNQDYNFSFSATNSLGDYKYNTCGDSDGVIVCENIDFTINKLGEELTGAKTGLYIMLTIFVFGLFVFSFWLNMVIPLSNQVDEKGNMIFITRKKYIKIALVPVTYSLFAWFLNLILTISDKLISGFGIYYAMFSFFTQSFIALIYPVFILTLVWFFWNFFRDMKWSKQIQRWGRVVEH